MRNFVHDNEGKSVATVKEGDLFDQDGRWVGALRRNNVYDATGKFIYHLTPDDGRDSAGSMTSEAVYKLFHPKARQS